MAPWHIGLLPRTLPLHRQRRSREQPRSRSRQARSVALGLPLLRSSSNRLMRRLVMASQHWWVAMISHSSDPHRPLRS